MVPKRLVLALLAVLLIAGGVMVSCLGHLGIGIVATLAGFSIASLRIVFLGKSR